MMSQLHLGGTLDAATREQARVREHLAGAELLARRRRARLEPLPALCRALLLDELSRYRRRGRFPKNPDRGARPVPQFIDPHGTRCAVAHLMEISGQGELVRHIARTENAARVHALARLPELRAWLAAAGLSLDEAARIQPAYCYYEEAAACFCQDQALDGVALGTVVAHDGELLRVRLDQLYGDLISLRVGDEHAATNEHAPAPQLGEQIFVGYIENAADPYALALQRVAPLLTTDGDSTTCGYDVQAAGRPLNIGTAVEAMLADRDSCIGVLASDDSDWNERHCDTGEAPESPAAGSTVRSEAGCSLGHRADAGAGGVELTSAALLLALLSYRRRRR